MRQDPLFRDRNDSSILLLGPRRRSPSPRSFRESLAYALAGLRYAFTTQRNVRIHCVVGLVAVLSAVGLRLPIHEVVLVIALTTLVLCAELMNTAIESTLDLHAGEGFDPTVKSIKDLAAASVLVVSLGAAVLGASIFLPALAHAISR